MKRYCLLLLVFVVTGMSLFGQEKISIIPFQEAEGMAVGSPAETLAEVRHRAVNEAKLAALQQAGVSEQLAAYSDFFKSEQAGMYDEVFTSDILSSMNGAIRHVEVVSEEKRFTDDGALVVKVIVKGEVVRYNTEPDPAFVGQVEGLKMFYEDQSPLTLRIKASKDAYLRAFLISESEAFVLFPNAYESSFRFVGDKWVDLPSTYIDYLLETSRKMEMHRLIVVLLKEDIPYNGKVSYKNIMDWIFTLPPDMRYVQTHAFSVVQKAN